MITATALARVLPVYRAHGHDVAVACPPASQHLFGAEGASPDAAEGQQCERVDAGAAVDVPADTVDQYWTYNRIATMIGREPLPPIDADPQTIWNELISSRPDVVSRLPQADIDRVAEYIQDLPKPLILLNPATNMASATTSIPRDVVVEVYRQLLDKSPGTLLVADWEGMTPRIGSYRLRHLSDVWPEPTPALGLALANAVDVVVAVESPMLHLTSLTDTPMVSVCLFPGCYPTRTQLPRGRTVCVVPYDVCNQFNRRVRLAYNMIETPRGTVTQAASTIAGACLAMLESPRYLTPSQAGADVQLQQFVLDWERGYENPLSGYVDRNRGFDALLREIKERFTYPTIVETSTISCEESWRVDGYATYLLGAFLQRFGGRLISVDPTAAVNEAPKRALSEISCVTLVADDPSVYLTRSQDRIDVLVVNGADDDHERAADCCLSYVRAAEHALHGNSLILLDDTVFFRGKFTGRGATAVPWLQDRGWRILRSGYQTILARQTVD